MLQIYSEYNFREIDLRLNTSHNDSSRGVERPDPLASSVAECEMADMFSVFGANETRSSSENAPSSSAVSPQRRAWPRCPDGRLGAALGAESID